MSNLNEGCWVLRVSVNALDDLWLFWGCVLMCMLNSPSQPKPCCPSGSHWPLWYPKANSLVWHRSEYHSWERSQITNSCFSQQFGEKSITRAFKEDVTKHNPDRRHFLCTSVYLWAFCLYTCDSVWLQGKPCLTDMPWYRTWKKDNDIYINRQARHSMWNSEKSYKHSQLDNLIMAIGQRSKVQPKVPKVPHCWEISLSPFSKRDNCSNWNVWKS